MRAILLHILQYENTFLNVESLSSKIKRFGNEASN